MKLFNLDQCLKDGGKCHVGKQDAVLVTPVAGDSFQFIVRVGDELQKISAVDLRNLDTVQPSPPATAFLVLFPDDLATLDDPREEKTDARVYRGDASLVTKTNLAQTPPSCLIVELPLAALRAQQPGVVTNPATAAVIDQLSTACKRAHRLCRRLLHSSYSDHDDEIKRVRNMIVQAYGAAKGGALTREKLDEVVAELDTFDRADAQDDASSMKGGA